MDFVVRSKTRMSVSANVFKCGGIWGLRFQVETKRFCRSTSAKIGAHLLSKAVMEAVRWRRCDGSARS